MRTRVGQFGTGSCVILAIIVGCSSSPDDEATSHQRMLSVLAEIAERTPDENPLLGDRMGRRFRKELAALDEFADPAERVRLLTSLAYAELRAGNNRAAIRLLNEALILATENTIDTQRATHTRFIQGVAYLRLGEMENCCNRNSPESCILPIRGGGVHVDREGSSRAIEYFRKLLDSVPNSQPVHLKARWLLNIAYMTLGKYPQDVPPEYLVPPSAFETKIDFPHFPNVARKLGVDTFNLCGGAIVDDFGNDGYLDIVTSTWDTTESIHLVRNNRDGTFSEVTKQAGLEGIFGGLNIEQADYNNDGHLDILVLRGAWLHQWGRHPNSLLHNNGDGTFTDVTFDAGLGEVYFPTQTGAWADYDNDGDLDLCIGNESSEKVTAYNQLFRNNGDGTFEDVGAEAGVRVSAYTKGVAWGDYNGDRFPDLYFSNYGPNHLFRNNRDGTFTNVAEELGVTHPTTSFPVWFWDFDNDGVLDLFVTSYTGTVDHVAAHYFDEPTRCEFLAHYRGDGKGGFENLTLKHGLNYPALPMGSNFGDLNNDGYLDIYLGTGAPPYESLMPNVMFLNQGGKGFVDVTQAGGFGQLQKGHGVAFADLDNDGDADVFEQMGGFFPGDKYFDCLYENPGFGNHWIAVQLVGVQSNRSAIGARIHVRIVEGGTSRSIYRHVNSGGSFGCNPLRQTIGLGKADKIEKLEVFWPTTGKTQTFGEVGLDQFIQLVEGDEDFSQLKLDSTKLKPAEHRDENTAE